MNPEQIQKNKFDMKYQITSSVALKSGGLAITIPLAIVGLGLESNGTSLAGLGLIAFSIFGFISLIFFVISVEYFDKLDDLKD